MPKSTFAPPDIATCEDCGATIHRNGHAWVLHGTSEWACPALGGRPHQPIETRWEPESDVAG